MDAIDALVIPDPDLTPYLEKAGGTMTGSLILAEDPILPLEAATKQYVDETVTGLGDGDFKADGSVAMTGELRMGGFKLRDLGAPGLSSDAATKSYVDGEVSVLQG